MKHLISALRIAALVAMIIVMYGLTGCSVANPDAGHQ